MAEKHISQTGRVLTGQYHLGWTGSVQYYCKDDVLSNACPLKAYTADKVKSACSMQVAVKLGRDKQVDNGALWSLWAGREAYEGC